MTLGRLIKVVTSLNTWKKDRPKHFGRQPCNHNEGGVKGGHDQARQAYRLRNALKMFKGDKEAKRSVES